MNRSLKVLGLLFVLGCVVASCAHRPKTFNFGRYSEGERLFNKGDYPKAIREYQAYIDEHPEGHLAVISQYYIAKSYAALGHTGEAKKAYQEIIKRYPDVVWANFAQTQLKELEQKQAQSPVPKK